MIPAIAGSSSTMNSNSPSTNTTGSFAPSLLKRDHSESISMQERDDAPTTTTTPSSNPPKIEPQEDFDRNTGTNTSSPDNPRDRVLILIGVIECYQQY
mmetsp:Transcript_27271/g.57095  ORF Transcript_27271/g.57095 Transcript_27271/m.57095 type:complete len:98 (-) Transcript_27271:49-342(-)